MDHRENQAFHGGAHDVHGKGHVIGVDQREQLNLRAADEQPVKVISLSVSLAQDELPQAWQEDGFAGPQGQLLRWLAKERDSVAHHGGAGEDLGREGGGTAHAAEVHDDKILDVVIAFQGTDPIPEAVVAVEAGDGESDGVEGARVGVSGARHRLHHRRVCFWKPLATGPTMGQNRASSRTEGHKSLDPGLGMGQHHWRQAGGTQGREELGWELADAGSIRWGSGVGGGWRQRKDELPQSRQVDVGVRGQAAARDGEAHHGGAGENLGREGDGAGHAAGVDEDEILDAALASHGADPVAEAVVAVEVGACEPDAAEGARVGVDGTRHLVHHHRGVVRSGADPPGDGAGAGAGLGRGAHHEEGVVEDEGHEAPDPGPGATAPWSGLRRDRADGTRCPGGASPGAA
ncbi:hypothetical protein OsI_02695 [Oryza sativa Indica Group]|uniref:Uncharacterized protein n=1 Tax=Oryza sativa subsp. indica TaxID=39946 RepID=B8AB62_ORYSI|nr:hypothetical protein OsI_02695 [Oryza sativa Indica Group]